ncbi:MAG: hypothetical protein LCI00_28760 [Chloroflexi bacterium]|nr:hypothetical protein [Chloroflexota bacterium]MCC6891539.1 hypothetical protein [Anaerolineae bacterium]
MLKKWTLRQKITVLGLLITVLVLTGYALYNSYRLQAKSLLSFDPADYGLPAEIGGYQIRVAQSWETRLCNPSTDLDLSLYAIPDQPQTLTTGDIQKLQDLTGRVLHLRFVSWPITIEAVKSQSEVFDSLPCIYLGGPLPDDDVTGRINLATAEGLPPSNNPIIPPTPDTNAIIAPPTRVHVPPDSPIIPPTSGAG